MTSPSPRTLRSSLAKTLHEVFGVGNPPEPEPEPEPEPGRTLKRRDPGSASPKHPKWMLLLRPGRDQNQSRIKDTTEWRLSPYNQETDRALPRVMAISWFVGLKETHEHIETIRTHLTDQDKTKGKLFSATEIANLYNLTGNRYGAAKIHVNIDSIQYMLTVNGNSPDAFQTAIDSVYDPHDGPQPPPAPWKTHEVNPRHPDWTLTRETVEDNGVTCRNAWAFTTRAEEHSVLEITTIRWTNETPSPHTDADADAKTTNQKVDVTETRRYSPKEMNDIYETNRPTDDQAEIEIKLKGITFTRTLAKLDAEQLNDVINTVYHP